MMEEGKIIRFSSVFITVSMYYWIWLFFRAEDLNSEPMLDKGSISRYTPSPILLY